MAKRLTPQVRVKRLVTRVNKKQEVLTFTTSKRGVPMAYHSHRGRWFSVAYFAKRGREFRVFIDGDTELGRGPSEKHAVALLQQAWLEVYNNPGAPEDFVHWCNRCNRSGVYQWGADECPNSGQCYGCNGKGYRNAVDVARCRALRR